MSKKWEEGEIEFIKNNYKILSDEEIAKELGRSESSISTRRKRLGLTRSNRKYDWNDVVNAFANTELILVSEQSDYKDSAANTIKYICPKHKNKGIMTIALGHLLNGEGCFFCGRETTGKKKTTQFNEELYKKLCDEKGYTYIGAERIKGLIYVKFLYNKHKELGVQRQLLGNLKRKVIYSYFYKVKPISRKLDGVIKKTHSSYSESLICILLNQWSLSYKQEYKFDGCKDKRNLPFDFFLPDYNVCIEYDGEQHYYPIYGDKSFELTHKHDFIKNKFCNDNNITLIRIPYWEYNNMSNYLFNKLVETKVIKLIS